MVKFALLLLIATTALGTDTNDRPPGWVHPDRRVDCHPDPDSTEEKCLARNCVWSWDVPCTGCKPNAPACFLPPKTGYIVDPQFESESPLILRKSGGNKTVNCPFGADASVLAFTVEFRQQIMFLMIQDPLRANQKKIPEQFDLPGRKIKATKTAEAPPPGGDTVDMRLQRDSDTGFFSFKVQRRSTRRVLFDTSIGGLFYADQFVQIAATLPSSYIYGFGEHPHTTLKHNMNVYKKWPMFARDEPPYYQQEQQKNLYGVHPFYMGLEPDGNAHGVFFFNTHAQDIETGPAPHLVYRAIGPALEVMFLPGPTPQMVIEQYHAIIGKPVLPSYWSLGFQICRYGYKNLAEVEMVVNRTRAAGIPQETQYVDIDYMKIREDFTYDHVNFAGLPAFIDQLHKMKMHNILILDPAIMVDYPPFVRGLQAGAFIRWFNQSLVPAINDEYPSTKGSDVMLGNVWPANNTAFPDFLLPQAQMWWVAEIKKMHEQLHFDGLWIDMNEPSNFNTNKNESSPTLMCPKDQWDVPPFMTYAVYWHKASQLSDKTLCMGARNGPEGALHYSTHNLFGLAESVATRSALSEATGKRGIVISRSTFPGSGSVAGHWLGDNSATWQDLRASIIGCVEMNMFGLAYIGADVCGFNGNTTEELCLRWQQLGAWYPMFRNHNGYGYAAQDPAVWDTVADAAQRANNFRNSMLPNLYSLHYHASIHGGTVFQPLFFNFPHDFVVGDIQEQFMWGDSILVTPVLYPGAESVTGYFPGSSRWYTLSGAAVYGTMLPESGWVTLDAPKSVMIPSHLRSGKIITRQLPGLTLAETRTNAIWMVIGAEHKEKDNRGYATASGYLYWDDGDSLPSAQSQFWTFLSDYEHNPDNATVNIFALTSALDIATPPFFGIEVFGAHGAPFWSSFMLDGTRRLEVNLVASGYDQNTHKLVVFFKAAVDMDFSTMKTHTISWQHGTH